MSATGPTARIRRDLSWNIVSLAFLAIAGLALNFVIGRYYDTAVLGIFNQVLALYVICSQLAVGGFCFSALAAMPAHTDRTERRRILTAALLPTAALALSVGILVAVAATTIARWLDSPAVAIGLWCVAPGLFFFALNKIFLFSLNGAGHLRAFAVGQGGRFFLY